MIRTLTILGVAVAMSIGCTSDPDIAAPDGEVFVPATPDPADGLATLPAEELLTPPSVEQPALPDPDLPPAEEPADPAEPNLDGEGPGTPDVTDPPELAPELPAEPDFADFALADGATFTYRWQLQTRAEVTEAEFTYTLSDPQNIYVDSLGVYVDMYRVTTTGDLPPGFRIHEALGATGTTLIEGRYIEDDNFDVLVLFDASDGGYADPNGFSALLPLVDTPRIALGNVDDGLSRYFGAAVWASSDAAEFYRSGVGFSALDVQGVLHDAEGNEFEGHLRLALSASSLLP
jgi:hypothetical protein